MDDSDLARFKAKFDADGDDGCWGWIAGTFKAGYGGFWIKGRVTGAHRASYEHYVGPIPDGLVIDHLCRNRACVNPDHLEPVTRGENVLRGEGFAAENAAKTECPAGHPYDSENTHINKRGHRICRACARERMRENAK